MSTPPARPAGQAMPELEIPADLAIEYVNMVRIAHSPSELVFDFAQLLPGAGAAKISFTDRDVAAGRQALPPGAD